MGEHLRITLAACEQQLPQEVALELENEILSDPAVDNYEVSTVRYAASKKLPAEIDFRWCVEVALESDGHSTVEHYMIDKQGEFLFCKQVADDQLTFHEKYS